MDALKEPEVLSILFFLVALIFDFVIIYWYLFEHVPGQALSIFFLLSFAAIVKFTKRLASGARFNYQIRDNKEIFVYSDKQHKYVSIGKLDNKVVLITGGYAGIGYPTSLALAKMGCRLVLLARDIQKAEEAKKKLIAQSGNQQIEVRKMDLSSLESIHNFVKEWNSQSASNSNIDILINNAGAAFTDYEKTKDGFEMHFGTNHVGPFVLTKLLIPNVLQTKGRIVTVASAAHKLINPKFDWKEINEGKNFSAFHFYGYSKLANIYMARIIAQNFGGLVSVSLHPGGVKTELGRRAPTFVKVIFQVVASLFFKTPEEGAQTTLFCSLSPDVESGKYYSDCRFGSLSKIGASDVDAQNLWKITEELLEKVPSY